MEFDMTREPELPEDVDAQIVAILAGLFRPMLEEEVE